VALNLAFEEYGAGQSLIIAHGLFGSRANWRSLARRLSSDFRVLLVDLRNHGKSPHSGVHDYPSMAGDILQFVRAHQLENTALLGHSMGGKAAMELAVTAPERVSRLIVVDVSPRAYLTSPSIEVLRDLLAVDLNEARTRHDVDRELAARGLDRQLREFLLMALTRSRDGRFRWKFNLPAIASNASRLGDAVSSGCFVGPALFIAGGKSGYVVPTDAHVVKSYFPNAQMVVIPRASHWPQIEAPADTYAAIREFLCT